MLKLAISIRNPWPQAFRVPRSRWRQVFRVPPLGGCGSFTIPVVRLKPPLPAKAGTLNACLWRCTFLLIVLVAPVLAHEGQPPQPHDLWAAWSLEPPVLIGLGLSAWLYWRGARRMANRRGWESRVFFAGWLALFVALVSPLDSLGGALFAAHMTQHEVLMLIAAPLLVLGRPLAPWLLALPVRWRRRLTDVGKARPLQRVWRVLVSPLAAWLIHAAVLWAWHAPLLFQATLANEWVHAAQHLSFLLSALLFCEALIYGREGRMSYGAAVIYVFTTAVHTSLLGALLTFSRTLWYPVYQQTTAAWGLTPMEDQQLGGLIMWVPAGLVYVAAGLALLAAWLRESERAVVRREKQLRELSG